MSALIRVLSENQSTSEVTALAGPLLGTLFDAVELMAPKLLERFGPVVNTLELLGVEPVQALPPLLVHRDEADFAEHAEMLRHRRLRQRHGCDHGSYGQRSAPREQPDNLSPPRFGDGVEYVGCRSSPRHELI